MSSPLAKQPASPLATIATVKYSLPEMLTELKHERVTGTFAMEKLHQSEIVKLFKAQPKRRRAKTSE
jgi:hypothetical protein